MAEKSYNQRHIVNGAISVCGDTCLGCQDTKTDIMLTFIFKGDNGDFNDIFLTESQAALLAFNIIRKIKMKEVSKEVEVKPKRICSNKVNGSCPLHNLFCNYPECEE